MAETGQKDIIEIGEKRFEVVGLLGKGGFGKVFKVVEVTSGRKLAIKCIYQEIQEGDRMYAAIAGEIRMMQKLQHPNIIRLIGYNLHGVHQGQACVQLVEELAPMCELLEYNIHCPTAFPEEMCLFIMKQVCDAVAFMHDSGIAHRDLKPQNILLDRKFNIKLADFGFAKAFMKKEQAVAMKSHLGTPGYMAPEISLRQQYTPKVDVFALGVVLFVCLSQRCPFKKALNDPQFWYWNKIATKQWNVFWLAHQRRHKFSSQQKDLIEKMLAADPNERLDIYETMKHPWFLDNKNKLPTKEDYIKQMTKRYKIVRKKVQEERQKDRSVMDPNKKAFWSVGELLHNEYRKRFALIKSQDECAELFAECAGLQKAEVLPRFEGQDLENLRQTFTQCTEPAHVQPYLPTPDPKVLEVCWTRLNQNLLVINEPTNFANVKVFEDLDNISLPTFGDGWGAPSGISQFEVKIGFGTLTLMLKDFHAQPDVNVHVHVEPQNARVLVSFNESEEIDVEGETVKVEDTLDLAVSMFRQQEKTFVSITSHGVCFFNDKTPKYVDMLLQKTKLPFFAVAGHLEPAMR